MDELVEFGFLVGVLFVVDSTYQQAKAKVVQQKVTDAASQAADAATQAVSDAASTVQQYTGEGVDSVRDAFQKIADQTNAENSDGNNFP